MWHDFFLFKGKLWLITSWILFLLFGPLVLLLMITPHSPEILEHRDIAKNRSNGARNTSSQTIRQLVNEQTILPHKLSAFVIIIIFIA